MKFSIVTPTYNPTKEHLERCLLSVRSQTHGDAQHLVIDDGSTNWLRPLPRRCLELWGTPIIRAETNQGPGAARNAAIERATGDWLVFLDSDDELHPGALMRLAEFIAAQPNDLDLVGYNWQRNDGGLPQRRDGHWLNGSREALLDAYLSLRMDGGPTFTAVRRETLGHHQFDGTRYHEDLAWLFHCYRDARRTAFLDDVLYVKRQHAGAATATVTEQHLTDFLGNWHALSEPYRESAAYERGVIGVVATRVREIYRAEKPELLPWLHRIIPVSWIKLIEASTLATQYAQAAKQFVAERKADPALFKKTWSCRDLHGSLFLAPDEVRACCKRFFVDGERRGDVVLTKAPVTLQRVRRAKEDLLDKINAGEPTACDGCPFMEFKEWGQVNDKVNYLSLEHHSVCNLACTYCDPKYYDGRQAGYDVAKLVGGLLDAGAMDPVHSLVVWGGGEPTVGREFNGLSERLASAGIHQRVLSNSVKHSAALERLLESGTVELTTSIDAGTEETFAKIRGRDSFLRVLRNLSRYSLVGCDRVTVKYILTEENCDENELRAFASRMKAMGLTGCNFQISCDFRQPAATDEQVHAVLFLYEQIAKAGAEVVFVDDLVRLRMRGVGMELGRSRLRRMAERIGLVTTVLADPAHYPVVAVVGGDEQAALLRETTFGKQAAMWSMIEHTAVVETKFPIAIAASQGYPATYRRLKAAGAESRIVKGLIL